VEKENQKGKGTLQLTQLHLENGRTCQICHF